MFAKPAMKLTLLSIPLFGGRTPPPTCIPGHNSTRNRPLVRSCRSGAPRAASRAVGRPFGVLLWRGRAAERGGSDGGGGALRVGAGAGAEVFSRSHRLVIRIGTPPGAGTGSTLSGWAVRAPSTTLLGPSSPIPIPDLCAGPILAPTLLGGLGASRKLANGCECAFFPIPVPVFFPPQLPAAVGESKSGTAPLAENDRSISGAVRI